MRYWGLIFAFVFVFIGLLAASKRKKREDAGKTGNLPPKKKKVSSLLPGETREYREYKDEKINTAPTEGFTGVVPGRDAAGLTGNSDIEKPVLTGDTAFGSSRRPVSGQTPVSSLLKTETSPGYEGSVQPAGISERYGSQDAVSVRGSNMSGTYRKPDQITVWEKINKLSMLKRAVVMSEILGPPKGSV